MKAVFILLGSLLLMSCRQDETNTPDSSASQPTPTQAAATADQSSVPNALPGGALDVDCTHVGSGLGGPGYQFIVTCPGRSPAPSGEWAVVQKPGESGGVALTDAKGRQLDEIPELRDGMPFVIFWSPHSDWFFANHYLGSSQEQLRPFQILNGKAIQRDGVYLDAGRVMARKYPCLHDFQAAASGWKWSPDGRRIAMAVYARPDACHVETSPGIWEPRGKWEVLWMIGNVESGKIDPASVHVRKDGTAPFPTTGPYADFN